MARPFVPHIFIRTLSGGKVIYGSEAVALALMEAGDILYHQVSPTFARRIAARHLVRDSKLPLTVRFEHIGQVKDSPPATFDALTRDRLSGAHNRPSDDQSGPEDFRA